LKPRPINEAPMVQLLVAFTDLACLVGCQDHGCLFSPPQGLGTNGGCQCLWKQQLKPGLAKALGALFRAVQYLIADEQLHGEERARQRQAQIEHQMDKADHFERLAEHYRNALEAAMRALANIEKAGSRSGGLLATMEQVRWFARKRYAEAVSALVIPTTENDG